MSLPPKASLVRRVVLALGLLAVNCLLANHAAAEILVSTDVGVLRYHHRTGAYLGVLVPPGSGGVTDPTGFALGPDGNLYVGDRTKRNIQRFDARTGDHLGEFASFPLSPDVIDPIPLPMEFAFAPSGDLFVTVPQSVHVIQVDGATGELVQSFNSLDQGQRISTSASAFGPDGKLYIGDNESASVVRFDPESGAFLGPFTEQTDFTLLPNDIAFGPGNDLYVANSISHGVMKYDGQTGESLGRLTINDLGQDISEFAFTADDKLLGIRSGSNELVRYSASGELMNVYSTQGRFSAALGMAIVPEPSSLVLCIVSGMVAVFVSQKLRKIRGS